MSQREVRVTSKIFLSSFVALLTLIGCGDDETTTTSGDSTTDATTSAGGSGTTSSGGSSTGGAASGGGGAGDGGSCADPEPTVGSPLADPDMPCDTLEAEGEPAERIVFLEKGEDSEFSNMIEVMYAWRYAARVPKGSEAEYTLEEERCSKLAGEEETCDVVPLKPLDSSCVGPVFGPKFALDPSQYNEGANEYRITLRLKKGCEVKSLDTFTMVLTYSP